MRPKQLKRLAAHSIVIPGGVMSRALNCKLGDWALVINEPMNEGVMVLCLELLGTCASIDGSCAEEQHGMIWRVDRPLWWITAGLAHELNYAPDMNLMPIGPQAFREVTEAMQTTILRLLSATLECPH